MNKSSLPPARLSRPWHEEPLPPSASQKAVEREYLGIAATKASADLWATLAELLENDDGSKRQNVGDAAKKLGVSSKLIYRWLAGPTNMGIETAGRLAAALEADIQIVAIPWEKHNTQDKTHSFCVARMLQVKHIRSAALTYRESITCNQSTPLFWSEAKKTTVQKQSLEFMFVEVDKEIAK